MALRQRRWRLFGFIGSFGQASAFAFGRAGTLMTFYEGGMCLIFADVSGKVGSIRASNVR